MNNDYESKTSDDTLKNNFSNYISYQINIGIIIAIFIEIILLINNKWSLDILLYSSIPIFYHVITYIVLTLLYKKHSKDKTIYFLRGNCKHLLIILLISFLTLNIILSINTPKYIFKNITIETLKDEIVMKNIFDSEKKIYVVFGSNNCIYCKQMRDVYISSFNKANQNTFYYCDLSNVTLLDSYITDININSIPLIILFENGNEVDRLVGVKEEKDTVNFILENNRSD